MRRNMEPKVIKEELPADKECFVDTSSTSIVTRSAKALSFINTTTSTTTSTSTSTDRPTTCRTPDSPEGARLGQGSPTASNDPSPPPPQQQPPPHHHHTLLLSTTTCNNPKPPPPPPAPNTTHTSHSPPSPPSTQLPSSTRNGNGNASSSAENSRLTPPLLSGTAAAPPGAASVLSLNVLMDGHGQYQYGPGSLLLGPAYGGYHGGGNGGGGSYAACITRPLVKVRRFLSTLVQFGAEISTDIGDRVRSLVLNLVSSNLSIEEFHHSLQDVTNFPLRPFVLPFLRAHLPILQREIHALARTNKQSTLHYVRTHEHVILDAAAHSPVTEPSEIFLSNDNSSVPMSTTNNTTSTAVTQTPANGVKRKATDSISENGTSTLQDTPEYHLPPHKRQPLTIHNPFLIGSGSQHSHSNYHPPGTINQSSSHHSTTGHTNGTYFEYQQHQQQQPQQSSQPPPPQNYGQQRTTEEGNSGATGQGVLEQSPPRRGEEEWRNIHVMLNCILSMVEKTKRALTILQQRSSQDVANDWLRKQDVSADLKQAAQDIMTQAVRQTEDRVAEVRRRAEEAVHDVKRQAVLELQKAVGLAEAKANELVLVERTKMDKFVLTENRRQEDMPDGTDRNSAASPNLQQTSPQNCCWNCGRKAHETCSGCNVARYCGPFCQHKDWETHHATCSSSTTKDKLRPTTTRCTTPNNITTTSGGVTVIPVTAVAVKSTTPPVITNAATESTLSVVKYKK